MRKATLIRRTYSDCGTFGDWQSDSGFRCKILERPRDIGEHPCIPAGMYVVAWTSGVHPKHPECYELTGVHGRTDILIHPANAYEQLLGCLAPGTDIGQVSLDWEGQHIAHIGVLNSRMALAALINDMGKATFPLTIENAS